MSVRPSVRNAMGELWFSPLLFKIDSYFFLWRLSIQTSIKYGIYFVRRSVSNVGNINTEIYKLSKKGFVILDFNKWCINHLFRIPILIYYASLLMDVFILVSLASKAIQRIVAVVLFMLYAVVNAGRVGAFDYRLYW